MDPQEKAEIEKVVDVLEKENLYPKIKIFLKDTENQYIYYGYIDYKTYNEKQKGDKIYQHLIKFQKSDNYIIKETKNMEYPLDFDMILEFLNV